MKFVSIVGARPQFIKLAPVSRQMRRVHREVIVHTGQHYDAAMSASFFTELAIPHPDYHLGIGSGPHGEQTGRMLAAIEDVLVAERPDGVIVFGDTNSTLAGALAAAKLGIPVAHVEAGLRSFNRAMPEEINRVLTDHMATRLFCPTATACEHARSEGITRGVELVGDVMCDVLRAVEPALAERAEALLAALAVTPRNYILATIHRPANTDDPVTLERIAGAFAALEFPVILPIHPRTRASTERYGLRWASTVHLIEPLGYTEMLTLQRYARCVATDSGGVQKEAFLLGTPCVTLRQETEWPETLVGGWNVLAGSDRTAIIAAVSREQPAVIAGNPFGMGDAANRIAESLRTWP